MSDLIDEKIEEMDELYQEIGLTDEVVELLIEINELQKELESDED